MRALFAHVDLGLLCQRGATLAGLLIAEIEATLQLVGGVVQMNWHRNKQCAHVEQWHVPVDTFVLCAHVDMQCAHVEQWTAHVDKQCSRVEQWTAHVTSSMLMWSSGVLMWISSTLMWACFCCPYEDKWHACVGVLCAAHLDMGPFAVACWLPCNRGSPLLRSWFSSLAIPIAAAIKCVLQAHRHKHYTRLTSMNLYQGSQA
eukprot:1160694-Pelagomonas_calceolata.AAC.6